MSNDKLRTPEEWEAHWGWTLIDDPRFYEMENGRKVYRAQSLETLRQVLAEQEAQKAEAEKQDA